MSRIIRHHSAHHLWIVFIVALAAMLPFTMVSAQEIIDPNANISFPPPVFVLCGETEIIGSANLADMTRYFISYRELNSALEPLSEDFLPAILPQSGAVQDDVLGVWDTEIVDDGIYELRLTINQRSGQTTNVSVLPLRVANELEICNQEPAAEPTSIVVLPPSATPGVVIAPTATPTLDPTPRVTVNRPSANVRQGDGTEFPIIGSLSQGQTAPIVGISSRGTGWYQVRLPNGTLGWMAPSVVDVSGNLSLVPSVVPPPLPATPTPTLTPTPVSQANLVAGIVVLDPASPVCSQTFTVGLDVANLGTTQTIASGIVSLTDVRAADGSIQGTTIGGFPVLLPGQTFRVNMPLTISTWYNETHRITLVIDQTNSIPESNETDNTRVIEYVLQKGPCP